MRAVEDFVLFVKSTLGGRVSIRLLGQAILRAAPVGLPQRVGALRRAPSDDFGTVVQQVLGLADQVATTLTSEDRERVAQHVVMTSRFAYMFWGMGYRQQV
jgi:hypothetical protein